MLLCMKEVLNPFSLSLLGNKRSSSPKNGFNWVALCCHGYIPDRNEVWEGKLHGDWLKALVYVSAASENSCRFGVKSTELLYADILSFLKVSRTTTITFILDTQAEIYFVLVFSVYRNKMNIVRD